jgi:transketolase
MRTAFINELILQARKNPKIFLVVGDLGFSVVEPFAEEFPDRYLNAGVAEQNMTGVAAGLASEGYHVFTYSIANFPTLRCLEQIRNDVAYHRLPVTVVSVGAGFAYGNLGYSHHAVQDIAILRTLPGMTILSPADPGETCECVQWLAEHPGPSYLRVGKAGETNLHAVRGLDRGPLLIRNGTSRTALVATGGILRIALEAHDQLESEGQSVPVYSLPWLKPVSKAFFASLAGFQRIIAIEEHVAEGGLADVLRENVSHEVEVCSVCVPEATAHQVGSQPCLRGQAGMAVSDVVERSRTRAN